jgi:hypothetical protein
MSKIYWFNTFYNLNLHTSLILTHVVQKETTEHEFDRKKSVTGIHRDNVTLIKNDMHCRF